MTVKIVIFDMDGTLLNTLDDLTDSTNFALNKCGLPQKTTYEISSFIGDGITKLIERAIPLGLINPKYNECLAFFKKNYEQNMYNKTKVYHNIPILLKKLKERNIKTAVVSNKFDSAVKNLADKYFHNLIDIAIGENEQAGVKKKPAPDMVLAILNKLNIKPSEAVYVGDSNTDIETAHNAKIKSISVTWGYKTKEFLIKNGASHIIDTPLEILNLL